MSAVWKSLAATLLLVAFPDAQRAQDAQSGLQGAGIDDLVVTTVRRAILGAVFGQPTEENATALIDQALAASK